VPGPNSGLERRINASRSLHLVLEEEAQAEEEVRETEEGRVEEKEGREEEEREEREVSYEPGPGVMEAGRKSKRAVCDLLNIARERRGEKEESVVREEWK